MTICIVLNYNDWKTTQQFVNSIELYDEIDKIVVVDNHSIDDSFIKLQGLKSEKVDIIQTQQNNGYASGNNYGIKYAIQAYQTENIIISNPDVHFFNDDVHEMKRIYDEKEKVGIVTCKMISLSQRNSPVAWKIPNYIDCLLENLILLRKLIKANHEYKDIDESAEGIKNVDVLPGSFFMISSEALLDVDFFDENTFLYYEENILCKKLLAKGYRNYLITNRYFEHNHSVTIDKEIRSVRRKLLIAGKSREYYCKQYLHIGKIRMLIYKLLLYIGVFNYSIAKRIHMLIISNHNY